MRDKIFNIIEDVRQKGEKTNKAVVDILTLLKDEGWVSSNDHLAEINNLQKIISTLNPCGHKGVESISCDICGYPDPRKLIGKLKNDQQLIQSAFDVSIEMGNKLKKEITKLKENNTDTMFNLKG